jgi:hypothetical protein
VCCCSRETEETNKTLPSEKRRGRQQEALSLPFSPKKEEKERKEGERKRACMKKKKKRER